MSQKLTYFGERRNCSCFDRYANSLNKPDSSPAAYLVQWYTRWSPILHHNLHLLKWNVAGRNRTITSFISLNGPNEALCVTTRYDEIAFVKARLTSTTFRFDDSEGAGGLRTRSRTILVLWILLRMRTFAVQREHLGKAQHGHCTVSTAELRMLPNSGHHYRLIAVLLRTTRKTHPSEDAAICGMYVSRYICVYKQVSRPQALRSWA